MSALNYTRSQSLIASEDLLKFSPINIDEALKRIEEYIDTQLPEVFETEFIPICFDVAKDQMKLVIGGQHGNLAIFDVISKKMTKDIELITKSITSVKFALDDSMVIAAIEDCTIFFLEFPSFYLLHTVNLPGIRIVLQVGVPQDTVYASDMTNCIFCYYLNNFEDDVIDTEHYITYFDISKDGSMLAYAVESGSVKLLHTETKSVLQSTKDSYDKVEILKFSDNIKYLSAAFENFVVKVWNIDLKMTIKHVFSNHGGQVRGLAFVNSDRYLVTGSADKKIVMHDMRLDSAPFTFELFDAEILCFRVSNFSDKLYFSQNLNKVMVWEIPAISKNVRYKKHTDKVNKILFIPGTFELLSLGEDGIAAIWDYQSDQLQEYIKIDDKLITGVVSSKAQYAFISSTKPSLIRLNISNCKYYDYEINSTAISIQFSSDENLLAIGDELYRVIIFDSVIMERKYIIKGHVDVVTEIHFLENDTYVISASRDMKLMKWDNATSNRLSTYDGHRAAILAMVISKDEEIAVSGDERGDVIIWSIAKEVALHKISQKNYILGPISLYLSSNKSYIIIAHDLLVSYYEIKSMALMFQKSTLYPARSITITQSENIIAVAEGNTIFLEENPLNSSKVQIVGKSYGSPHKFMNYIREVTTRQSRVKHLDIYNHWMFTPYKIGIAHILALINNNTNLTLSLFGTSERASYCSTTNGENPLSISIEMDHKSCIEVCLKYMKMEFSRGNERAYSALSNCLTSLTALDIPSIPRLYDTLFQRSKSLHLPNFVVHEKANLPSLCHSKSFLINVEKLLDKDNISSHGESVIFYQSLCPLNLDIGTIGSINFLQSILDCSYSEIFRSKLLNVLLRDKWERINWAIYAQGMLYIAYLVQFSIFCIFFKEPGSFLISLFIVHVLLFIYEIIQIVTDFYDYWKDMWNILDQLRGISFTIYAYMEWTGQYDKNVLLTAIIFSWTRGISYFRMFEGTRYMVRLLSEVITDMQVFFVILSYSTLAFSFVLFLNKQTYTFGDYLTIAYRLNLGSFKVEDYIDIFDWLIFFFATMINPVIMLNLLISIMSNTYSRVKEGNDIANFQELTEMILEIEKLMFWKRKNFQQFYLQQCVSLYTVEDDEGDKALERLKAMRKHVGKIEKTVHYINAEISSEKFLELHDNLNAIKVRDNEYKELIGQNKRTLDETNELMIKLAEKLRINISSRDF